MFLVIKKNHLFRVALYVFFFTGFFTDFNLAIAEEITAQEWIDKSESWLAKGSYTADIKVYAAESGHQGLITTIKVWFRDDPEKGWSYRLDFPLKVFCGTTTYKHIDTPQGRQTFLDNTCVYPPENDLVGFKDKRHDVLPNIFYAMDPNQDSFAALNELSSNTSVSETMIDGVSVWKLAVTWDINRQNQFFNVSSKQLNPYLYSMTSLYYIRSDNGQWIQVIHALHRDGKEVSKKLFKWANINTSPEIPDNTFQLTQDRPSSTITEAFVTWLEANSNN